MTQYLTRPPDSRQHASAERLTDYFVDAAMLRWCLAYNNDDYSFAFSDGGRIVYLFDANIVRFFIEPEKEASKIIAFKDKEENLRYASATALITAEFLFSRELAGQRRYPPLIAPAHGDELADFINGLNNDLKVHAEGETESEEYSVRLSQIVEKIRRRNYSNLGSAAKALQKVVPDIAGLLVHQWAPMKQFRRLFDEDLLRPLRLHTAATQDILNPNRMLKGKWAKRIADERNRQHDPRKNDRDAEALMQVMSLDAEALKEEQTSSGAESQKIRYVLVTADMALFNAYAKWYWNVTEQERGRFVLRIPLQYVPILNTKEMPNQIFEAELTKKALAALDSLFGNLRGVDDAYPHKLSYYRTLALEGGALSKALRDMYGFDPLTIDARDVNVFRVTRTAWHHAFANGVLLNSPLMERRHKHEFEALVEMLRRNTSLRISIERDLEDNLSRIIDAHADFTTKVNVGVLASLYSGTTEDIPAHRTPFLVRTDHSRMPPSMVQLMRGVSDPVSSQPLLADARIVLGNIDLKLLLAAVIAFRRGHWIAARIYADQALALENPSEFHAEFQYLLGASTRYMLGLGSDVRVDRSDVEQAETVLEASVAAGRSRGDRFAELRGQVELCALSLASIRRRVLYESEAAQRDELPHVANRVRKVVKAVTRLHAEIPRQVEGTLGVTLAEHAASVALAAALFRRFLLPGWSSEGHSRFDPRGLIAERRTLEHSPLATVGAPINVAHLLVAQCLADNKPPELISEYLGEFLESKKSDTWLSQGDQLELEHLCHALATEGMALGPALPPPMLDAQ